MICFNCASNATGELSCDEPCDGDQCAIWKHKSSNGSLRVEQGCLTNVPLAIGCRRNQVGAQLCICDDGDLCNRVERAENTLQPLPIRFLPSVSCEKHVGERDFSYKAKHFCRSHFCHYTLTTTNFGSTGSDQVVLRSCADQPEYDFDLKIQSSMGFLGLFPNGLYRFTTVPNTDVLTYVCSTNNCTSRRLPELRDGLIQCYIHPSAADLSQSKLGHQHFCYGHFCFIQHHNGKISKGCLSVNEEGTRFTTRPGYRRVMKTEQWLCRSHLCNWDFDRVNRSWHPPTTPFPRTKIANASFKLFPIIVILLRILKF
ncbi:unnamed protein product, partial [Mesorhabditis belari]|uniref:DUF7622 domain-containing protein n=1 Tax=Mesorhabditis belari TaxID=2138241 RepID=A0AAF3F3N5_9BILA